jgi:hypothetical protein
VPIWLVRAVGPDLGRVEADVDGFADVSGVGALSLVALSRGQGRPQAARLGLDAGGGGGPEVGTIVMASPPGAACLPFPGGSGDGHGGGLASVPRWSEGRAARLVGCLGHTFVTPEAGVT